MDAMKKCKECGIEKSPECFRGKRGKICLDCLYTPKYHYWREVLVKDIPNKICIDCGFDGDKSLFDGKRCFDCAKVHKKQVDKAHYEANKEEILAQTKAYQKTHKGQTNAKNKKWKKNNPDKVKADRQRYWRDNKETIKVKRQENKEAIAEYKRIWEQNKRETDVTFRLHQNVSALVRRALKKSNGSKRGKSILDCLPYTMLQLKEHLEKQFETWMTWDNWTMYDPETWNENDPSTWVWNIDHIVPRSRFPYLSMEEDNFRKCWALDNLRPYSAKRNLSDGNRRAV